jgi:hypothetical protein
MSAELLRNIRTAAAPFGLNLIAAVPAPRYDAAVGAAYRSAAFGKSFANRSIIAIANGGGDFWRAFVRWTGVHPEWNERANPLDDFTRRIVEDEILPLAKAAGVDCVSVYPFMSGAPTLNFMELGKLAGIAGPSLLGVVVNPRYGPWIAFRAALVVDAVIDAPGDALGFDPCPRCATRACIAACPARAVVYPAGWDVPRCLEFRVENEPRCAPRCDARAACVLGPEHRYPPDELEYHQRRALAAMRPWYEANRRPRS